jgi:hypothetical protein
MEHLQQIDCETMPASNDERVSIDTFLATAAYDEMFGLEGMQTKDVRSEASVQIIYTIGWTPAPTQQQPKKTWERYGWEWGGT